MDRLKSHRHLLRPSLFALSILLLAGSTFRALQAQNRAQPSSAVRPLDNGAANRLRADVAALTKFPSRAPGTPGNLAAAQYMRTRFSQVFGAGNVRVDEYNVTAPVTKSAELTLNGRALKVLPVYPNAVVPSTTPRNGITGPLVYAGQGRASDFNGQPIAGSIVVLDFNSGLGWVTAADLGARAIIFLEPTSRGNAAPSNRGEAETKFATLPVELPRYYATGDVTAALLGAAPATSGTAGARLLGTGTLKSLVRWERVKTRNVLGTIKGTDRSLDGKPGSTLVINGYYDSMSITPDLAPGAEAAGNAAALLELARYYKANPPKYNLLFVANGAHHLALAGVRNFIEEHFLDRYGKGGDDKKKEIDSYRAFIGLDLTSRTDTVGLFAKSSFYNQMTVGSENILLNQFANFAKAINIYAADEAKRRRLKSDEQFYVDGITGREGRSWRSYLPSLVALDSEAATMAQKPGISFATANDARLLQDTPFDVAEQVNYNNLAEQVGTISTLLTKGMADIKDLPETSAFSKNFGYVVSRAIYRDVGQGTSFLPDTPIPDDNLLKTINQVPQGKTLASTSDEQKQAQAEARQKYLERLEGATAVGYTLDPANFHKSYSGVRGAFVERAEFSKAAKGASSVAQFVFVGPRVGDPKGGGTPDYEIDAYSINKDGKITFAPDQGAERQRFSPKYKSASATLAYKDEALGQYNVNATVITFECRSTTMYDTLDQRYFTLLRELTVLDGSTDANPVEYGFLRPAIPAGSFQAEPIAIVFAKPGTRFKLIMSMGLLGKRLVLLQTNPQVAVREGAPNQPSVMPEGAGFLVPDDMDSNSVIHVSYQTARDLWILDQQRINILKRFGIDNARVELLHGSVGCAPDPETAGAFKCPTDLVALPNGGALKNAELALASSEYDRFYLESRRAFGLESRAYPDVEATAQDVLKGIVFYLALLLPFSYFLERLLFGFPDIRKQIAGASIVFLAIFTGIRFVHPAFELAMTPFIILLAFVILALTVVVTSFLSSKFEQEIKKLKQGVHFADVGRLSAIGAAVGLGIANMRRRPMRTALTCVTLVLLTFTVLSFTSVTANISNFARPYGNTPPAYEGLMVRNPDWSGMQQSVVQSMTNEFSQRFGAVAPRAWYLSRDQGEALQLRVNNANDASKYFYAPALVGFTPEEKTIGSPVANSVIKGQWFDGTRTDVCLLPASMLMRPSELRTRREAAAQARGEQTQTSRTDQNESDELPLGLTQDNAVGSRIQIAGQELEIIGVFDDDKFYAARDLDDEQLTPVDYQNEANKATKSTTDLSGAKGEETQVQRYQHMDANALLLLPYDTVLAMGGSTRSLAAGFKDTASGLAELDQLMNRAALGIFGSTRDKNGNLQTALYSSVETTGYEGFAALLIPVTIAALIIANTMLGSVFERTREIGIYSAVGLAPIHVAALFIAEAMVYAVLGSISGYLVAQLVAKVITSTNLLPGITLNYSSSSAVLATLIVMATVLLSTLYPAWAASKLSNPDTARKWKVNEPIGDIWRFQFPFTVSGLQPLGVAQFLADFAEAHTDTSVGRFYTDKVGFTALPLRDAVTLLNEGLESAILLQEAQGSGGKEGNGTNGKLKLSRKGAVKATDQEPTKVSPIISLDAIPAPPDTEVYRLALRVWLAPFDMGVSQDTDIILLPSNEPGLYELQLRLVRQSGEIAAWQRVNRQFIGDLRKQLLVWRTVSREGQQEYILRGRAHVSGQALPSEQPGAAVSTMVR
jgi:hypothetical protein